MRLVEFEAIDWEGSVSKSRVAAKFVSLAYVAPSMTADGANVDAAHIQIGGTQWLTRISPDAAEYLEDFLERCEAASQ